MIDHASERSAVMRRIGVESQSFRTAVNEPADDVGAAAEAKLVTLARTFRFYLGKDGAGDGLGERVEFLFGYHEISKQLWLF